MVDKQNDTKESEIHTKGSLVYANLFGEVGKGGVQV